MMLHRSCTIVSFRTNCLRALGCGQAGLIGFPPSTWAVRAPPRRLFWSTTNALAADEGASTCPPPGVLYDSAHGFERRQELAKRREEEKAAEDVLHLSCTRQDIAKWRDEGGKVVILDLRERAELEYDPPLAGSISLPASCIARALKLDEDVWRNNIGMSALDAAERVVVYSNPDELKVCADAVRTLMSYDVKSVQYFLGGAREWNKYNNAEHNPVEYVQLPV